MGELNTKPTDKTVSAVQDPPETGSSGLEAVRHEVHGQKADSSATAGGERGLSEGAAGSDGFSIVAAPAGERGSKVTVLDSLKKTDFDAKKVAEQIEEACNGGWTAGAGTDEAGIANALKGLTPEQIKAVDDEFAKTYGPKYAKEGQRWGLAEEFKDELSGAFLDTNMAILNAKNEVPPERAATGESLLREGSDLKVGETNRVTLADGRKYDVYIPHNAQKPLPVMMLMHGASNGHDMSTMRIMEKETGMNYVAEQYGFAVVYPYNEPRSVSVLGVEQQPAVWNMKGNVGFLDVDPKYDDAKYLDRVIADVSARVQVDDTRIGMAGMSDGGRAAEQYALEHPGKVSALVAMNGTWMEGNKTPEAGNGLPTMLINSGMDHMLPHNQGEGWLWAKGRGMMSKLAAPWIPGTGESRPGQQLGVFKDANQCTGDMQRQTLHHVEIGGYDAEQCKTGEVKQYFIQGANHAWHDWRNEGGWYVVGMPDRSQNLSEETAKFILNHPLKRSF